MLSLPQRAAAFISAFAFAFAVPARAQPFIMLSPPAAAVPVRTEPEAVAEDAAVYVARYGASLDEAIVRLRAQAASVAATDEIAATYRSRLAGITIEHRPDYRIVVHLIDGAPVADRSIVIDGVLVPIVFRTGAAATRDSILEAIDRHQADIRASLIDPPGMGVDAATGRLAVAIGSDDAGFDDLGTIEARIEAIAHVPVHAFVAGHDANLAIAGGERLQSLDWKRRRVSRCTSGFLVTDGRVEALATAAHCPDDLSVVADDGILTMLTMIGAWGAGHQDVQLHAVPGSPPPLFHAGNAADTMRAVDGSRRASSLRTGDFVCHQGITSGYSCAEIRYTDYAPPGDLCAGPCPATWVMVDGPNCGHGDSGGPVFEGAAALGITKGGNFTPDGRCSAYYYMPLDYLPAGWSVLIGKDGNDTYRASRPTSGAALAATIDAMPMRRDGQR